MNECRSDIFTFIVFVWQQLVATPLWNPFTNQNEFKSIFCNRYCSALQMHNTWHIDTLTISCVRVSWTGGINSVTIETCYIED